MPEERDTVMDLATFNAAINPMRPNDIVVPGPIQALPPICPSGLCLAHAESIVYLLYVVTANPQGDVLLECLNCGYEAVYRVKADAFESRPGRVDPNWKAPYRTSRDVMQRMQKGEPAKFAIPEETETASVEKPARVVRAKKKQRSVETEPSKTEQRVEALAQIPTPVADAAPAPIKPMAFDLLEISDAAKVAQVHTNKLRFAIKRGDLKAIEKKGFTFIVSTDLEAWMQAVKRG